MNSESFYLIRFGSLAAFVTLLCLFFTVSVQAEELYIGQYSAGGDTGVNCANQKSVTWFNTAGNWGSGANKISAGDTVHLCGTITTSLQVQDSGSAGLPITILFEPGAKISKPSCSDYCLSTNSRSYITIDGGTNGIIESTNMGTGLTQKPTTGVLGTACNNCEIKNLTIRNMYVRTDNTDIYIGGIPANGKIAYESLVGIRMSGSNYRVHDNMIHDCGTGIQNFYANDETGVEVYNNDISRVGHSYALAGGNGKKTQGIFKYYNNYTHDYANWDAVGCAVAHTSGIHVYGDYNGSKIYGAGELWIYNNRMIGSGVCMTGQIFTETGTDPWTDVPTSTAKLRVFNNFLTAGSGENDGVNILGASGGNVEIYNNTVIGGGTGFCVGAGVKSTSVKIKNNYFANCAQLIYAYANTDISSNFELDYNVYATCSGYNCFWVGSVDVSNFAAYRTNPLIHDNFDIHSYADLSGTGGVEPSTGRPASGSLVINSGVDLSGIGYNALNSDLGGAPRGATWNIGAYDGIQSPMRLRAVNP